MSDIEKVVPYAPNEGRNANLIYILYLAGVIVGFTALIGIVMSYIYKGEGPEWVQTHYRFQIRTFWIGLLFSVVSGVLTIVLIGWLLLLLALVWFIIRCVKGMRYVSRSESYPNPATWMF
ncbi:MAG: DUF4870 family protein [Dongiaceae bacterium]